MGSSLKYTSECFLQCRNITNADAANTTLEVLSSSASDRRIYGFCIFNDNNSIQQMKVKLVKSGEEYTAFVFSSVAGAGADGTDEATDVFESSSSFPILQKRTDANGNPYFDLPAGWSIGVQYYTALSGTTTVHIFGETY